MRRQTRLEALGLAEYIDDFVAEIESLAHKTITDITALDDATFMKRRIEMEKVIEKTVTNMRKQFPDDYNVVNQIAISLLRSANEELEYS